jgi:ribosomal protein L37AE/L43A
MNCPTCDKPLTLLRENATVGGCTKCGVARYLDTMQPVTEFDRAYEAGETLPKIVIRDLELCRKVIKV